MKGPWRLALLSTEDGSALVAEGAPWRLAGEISSPGALGDIVAFVAQMRWRSELSVMNDRAERSLYFDSGQIVGARTNVPQERLGEVLLRSGEISRAELDAVLAESASSQRRVGAVLLDRTQISREALIDALGRHVKAILEGALTAERGVFVLKDSFDDASLNHRQRFDALALLLDATSRLDEMRFFRQRVPSGAHRPAPTPGVRTVPPELYRVYQRCDGHHTVAEIALELVALEHDLTREVFTLVSKGLLVMRPPVLVGPEAIVEAANGALRAIHTACEAVGGVERLHEASASFMAVISQNSMVLRGAGPRSDGSFDAARVARLVANQPEPVPDGWLLQVLQDYLEHLRSFASSLLSRDHELALSRTVDEHLLALRST